MGAGGAEAAVVEVGAERALVRLLGAGADDEVSLEWEQIEPPALAEVRREVA